MKDPRIIEKRADELIEKNRSITLRVLLGNGNIIERVITPVSVPGVTYKMYRDHRIVYKPNTPIKNIHSLNTLDIRRLENSELPSHSGKGNAIKSLFVELLKMGYEVIEE